MIEAVSASMELLRGVGAQGKQTATLLLVVEARD